MTTMLACEVYKHLYEHYKLNLQALLENIQLAARDLLVLYMETLGNLAKCPYWNLKIWLMYLCWTYKIHTRGNKVGSSKESIPMKHTLLFSENRRALVDLHIP